MQSYEDRIIRVLRYIHDTPAGDMSLDRLADEAAMSRFHWHRVFRAMTGETCAQAVRRVRLHRAATMLLSGKDAPEAIAQVVGYDNGRSFARAFVAHYGCTPLEFRAGGQHTPSRLIPPEGEFDMYSVKVCTRPGRIIAGLTHDGDYARIGVVFEPFFALCQSRKLWAQLGVPMGVYFHNPDVTPEPELRSLAGAELRHGDVPEGLQSHAVAAGRFAVMTYKGPHAGLHGAYDALFGQWLPRSGELPADAPCFEAYLNDARTTAPEELLTEIYLPLEARADD